MNHGPGRGLAQKPFHGAPGLALLLILDVLQKAGVGAAGGEPVAARELAPGAVLHKERTQGGPAISRQPHRLVNHPGGAIQYQQDAHASQPLR